MKYIFSYTKPEQHFLDIECHADNIQNASLDFQLPAWRPGRYELGNFAKNIGKFSAFDKKGSPLPFRKISKDCWRVETKNTESVILKYNYFCAQLDAGACWLDERQLYVNPVHCCMYLMDRQTEPCTLELHLPQGFEVASSMLKSSPPVHLHSDDSIFLHSLYASDFHELVDSPFIASDSLQHFSFIQDEANFHLWFMGACKPEKEKMTLHFKNFIHEQFLLMGSFPFLDSTSKKGDYHFLFQITPYNSYHGVEHVNSTVIALGPACDLNDKIYNEFLGISSHELFHAWNIKTIRPVEMMPYDYSKENYSRLGFVAEGVTTYYGDLFLLRSKGYSHDEFAKRFSNTLQKHFDNSGRLNYSVADSSFDTWLDGYVPGIPGRKVSIYTEGALCAFMLDTIIRKETANKKSLDDVMKLMHENFGMNRKGYSENDYLQTAEKVAGISLADFFEKYVYGSASYESLLSDSLNYYGCELRINPSPDFCESYLGFRHVPGVACERVTAIVKDSPAYQSGLALDDEIISVNSIKIENNLSKWCSYFSEEKINIAFFRKNELKTISLKSAPERYFQLYSLRKKEIFTEKEKLNYLAWAKIPF